jgi:hypothetical protein
MGCHHIAVTVTIWTVRSVQTSHLLFRIFWCSFLVWRLAYSTGIGTVIVIGIRVDEWIISSSLESVISTAVDLLRILSCNSSICLRWYFWRRHFPLRSQFHSSDDMYLATLFENQDQTSQRSSRRLLPVLQTTPADLSQKFAAICMLKAGSVKIDPDDIKTCSVPALRSRN